MNRGEAIGIGVTSINCPRSSATTEWATMWSWNASCASINQPWTGIASGVCAAQRTALA